MYAHHEPAYKVFVASWRRWGLRWRRRGPFWKRDADEYSAARRCAFIAAMFG